MSPIKNSSEGSAGRQELDPLPDYCDPPLHAGKTDWRWYSLWPGFAQVALMLTLMLSGATSVPYGTLIQPVLVSLFIVWLELDLLFNDANPRSGQWPQRKRLIYAIGSLVLVAGIFAILSMLLGL